jgi:hypothetical protein
MALSTQQRFDTPKRATFSTEAINIAHLLLRFGTAHASWSPSSNWFSLASSLASAIDQGYKYISSLPPVDLSWLTQSPRLLGSHRPNRPTPTSLPLLYDLQPAPTPRRNPPSRICEFGETTRTVTRHPLQPSINSDIEKWCDIKDPTCRYSLFTLERDPLSPTLSIGNFNTHSLSWSPPGFPTVQLGP